MSRGLRETAGKQVRGIRANSHDLHSFKSAWNYSCVAVHSQLINKGKAGAGINDKTSHLPHMWCMFALEERALYLLRVSRCLPDSVIPLDRRATVMDKTWSQNWCGHTSGDLPLSFFIPPKSFTWTQAAGGSSERKGGGGVGAWDVRGGHIQTGEWTERCQTREKEVTWWGGHCTKCAWWEREREREGDRE